MCVCGEKETLAITQWFCVMSLNNRDRDASGVEHSGGVIFATLSKSVYLTRD